MTINRIEQSVKLLPSIQHSDMLDMFAHVVATPYGNGMYDMDKNKLVIANCIKRGHLSILEHAHITLKCVTSIGTYKDYTRHRHCAFTIESTAFSKQGKNVEVITVDPLQFADLHALEAVMRAYGAHSIKSGRDYLPQCCAATMIMTTSVREWRYIIGCRGDPNDNPLTIELRDKIWRTLNNNYSFFFPLGQNTKENPMCIYDTWGDKLPAKIN
jgi:hypothetical protein